MKLNDCTWSHLMVALIFFFAIAVFGISGERGDTITLSPGDSISQMVAQIERPGTILLQSGTYQVEETVRLRRGLAIRGATGNPADVTLRFSQKSENFSNTLFSCSYEPTGSSNGVQVVLLAGLTLQNELGPTLDDGDVSINATDCRFISGRVECSAPPHFLRCRFENSPTVGLSLDRGGLCEECVFYGNNLAGAVVTSFVKTQFVRCRFEKNTRIGLFAFYSMLRVRDSRFDSNGSAGLEIALDSDVTLTDSQFMNEKIGIMAHHGGSFSSENTRYERCGNDIHRDFLTRLAQWTGMRGERILGRLTLIISLAIIAALAWGTAYCRRKKDERSFSERWVRDAFWFLAVSGPLAFMVIIMIGMMSIIAFGISLPVAQETIFYEYQNQLEQNRDPIYHVFIFILPVLATLYAVILAFFSKTKRTRLLLAGAWNLLFWLLMHLLFALAQIM